MSNTPPRAADSRRANAARSSGGRASPSILHPDVARGSRDGLLAVYSLSKQSNLAGYRAAFAAGDPVLVGGLLETRRHLGLIPPAPVQAATVQKLEDIILTKARDLRRSAIGG